MVRFLLALFFLASLPAHAINVGQVGTTMFPTGAVLSHSNMLVLACAFDSTHLSTFRKPGASSGYTPSGSNKFQIVAVEVSANFNTNIKVGHGTTDAGWLGASEPSSPIHEYTASSTATYPYRYAYTTSNESRFYNSQLQIPNGKYPFCNFDSGTGSGLVRIYGYETP